MSLIDPEKHLFGAKIGRFKISTAFVHGSQGTCIHNLVKIAPRVKFVHSYVHAYKFI